MEFCDMHLKTISYEVFENSISIINWKIKLLKIFADSLRVNELKALWTAVPASINY